MINLLDNIPNQPSRFWTRNWDEINDDARGTYNINSQLQIKAAMLNSSLCNYNERSHNCCKHDSPRY